VHKGRPLVQLTEINLSNKKKRNEDIFITLRYLSASFSQRNQINNHSSTQVLCLHVIKLENFIWMCMHIVQVIAN